MTKAVRVLGICVVLTLFFSITIGDKPIFEYIYSAISPATTTVQNAAESVFSKSYDSTSAYTKKLFNNSVPHVNDTVKSKLSAVRKSAEPLEEITIVEKKELDQLIRTKR